jgi:nucleotide-binding universal stress UspA family protein
MATRDVVVGVDGSAPSIRAALAAGELAVRHGLSLRVLHVFGSPVREPPFVLPSVAVQLDPRAAARELVDTAAALVASRHPGLSIETGMADADPPAALVDASRRAAFLVVGHRGRGSFAEPLTGPVAGPVAGSVAVHVATHARCPVLVVRGTAGAAEAPVVVGVDGSAPALAAARVALAEARVRGCDVVAALSQPSADGEQTDLIRASLDGVVDGYPDVRVRRETVLSRSPAHALAALAADLGASLIVVGSRGGSAGRPMGGTCRALLDQSPCPLIVVPPQ